MPVGTWSTHASQPFCRLWGADPVVSVFPNTWLRDLNGRTSTARPSYVNPARPGNTRRRVGVWNEELRRYDTVGVWPNIDARLDIVVFNT